MAETITSLDIGDRVIGPYGKGRITAIDRQRCEVTYDTTVTGGGIRVPIQIRAIGATKRA